MSAFKMKMQLKIGLIFLLAHFVNTLDSDPIVGIVGGRSIDIEQAPWQAHLQIFFTRKSFGSFSMKTGWCGGSIIHEKWILSAAHCTHFENVIAIRVRVGTVYSDKGGQIYEVKRIINHGRYDDNTLNYDFALLELANAIKFDNRTIKAIPLPNVYDFVSVRKMCFVSGWGLYSKYSSNEFPNVLQGVEVPIVPHGKCQQAYGNDITEQMLCAGFLYGSKDAAEGDSGGPLICSSIDGKRKLFGVVSFGEDGSNFPGIYSRVQAVRLWIKKCTGV